MGNYSFRVKGIRIELKKKKKSSNEEENWIVFTKEAGNQRRPESVSSGNGGADQLRRVRRESKSQAHLLLLHFALLHTADVTFFTD